jgi:glycine betaine/proline transport system ATP-binding protein
MKKADTLLEGHDTVKTASVRLRSVEHDAMYVLNKQRQPVGLVADKDVARAIRQKVSNLDEVMMKEFPVTEENTSLSEVLTLCGDSVPIAVVNGKGRFQGVLEPLDVLNSVSSQENGENDKEDAVLKE